MLKYGGLHDAATTQHPSCVFARLVARRARPAKVLPSPCVLCKFKELLHSAPVER